MSFKQDILDGQRAYEALRNTLKAQGYYDNTQAEDVDWYELDPSIQLAYINAARAILILPPYDAWPSSESIEPIKDHG